MKQLSIPANLHFEANKSLGKDYRKDDKITDKSGFLGKARIHQAVFRANGLGIDACDVYGNYLTEEDARKGYNFFGGLGIFEAVQADPKQRHYNKNVYSNMLRSEHIPFNFFIPLKNNLDYCTKVMHRYMPWIVSVDKVVIEYAPKQTKEKVYLSDRTSFDVYMEYIYSERGETKRGGIGIEVKYTERAYHVKPDSKEYSETTREYETSEYKRVMDNSSLYKADVLTKLQSDIFRQYWRNHLLGEAMVQNDDISRFTSVLLYPSANRHFATTSEQYKLLLNNVNDIFKDITYEDFIAMLALEQPSDEYTPWIDYLNRRYMVIDWQIN